MNFSARKRNRRTASLGVKNTKKHRLLFYNEPPVEEITLEEFEQFAVDRLKLLREVENVNIRFKRDSEEYEAKMEKLLVEFLPTYKTSAAPLPSERKVFMVRKDEEEADNRLLATQKKDRRKDHISHFILRLAFARTEDLRRWFITQELDLFRYRFKQVMVIPLLLFTVDWGVSARFRNNNGPSGRTPHPVTHLGIFL